MSHLLHVFPLISLHELASTTDAHQWNAHDHLEYKSSHVLRSVPVHCMYQGCSHREFLQCTM